MAGDVPLMEFFLRMGGVWRAEYFRIALEHDRLAFCQWAHKCRNLELDLPRVNKLRVYATAVIVWLASVGVFLSVTDRDLFRSLAALNTGQLPFIIEHYPRYVLSIYVSTAVLVE